MPLIRTRQLMLFFRELATMVQAGLPIIEAMADLARNFHYAPLRNAAAGILEDVSSGISLGETFGRFPQFFPEWQVGMIRYSEKSGRIAPSLTLIAEQLERDYSSLLNLLTALAYPLFILHVAIVLLPFTAFASCGLGVCVARGFGLLVMLYAVAAVIYVALSRINSSGLRRSLDNIVLNIPVVGNLVRQFCVARFCRALQAMSSSGVSIVTGWRLAADSTGNSVIKESLLRGLFVIESGNKISEALSVTGVFPHRAIQTIAVGEKSGSIAQTLENVARHAERENEAATALLVRVLPLVLYVAVAVFIGIRVVSFYVGYYRTLFSF